MESQSIENRAHRLFARKLWINEVRDRLTDLSTWPARDAMSRNGLGAPPWQSAHRNREAFLFLHRNGLFQMPSEFSVESSLAALEESFAKVRLRAEEWPDEVIDEYCLEADHDHDAVAKMIYLMLRNRRLDPPTRGEARAVVLLIAFRRGWKLCPPAREVGHGAAGGVYADGLKVSSDVDEC